MVIVDMQMICEISKAAINVSCAFNNDGLPADLSEAQDHALAELDLILAPLILEHFDRVQSDG